MDDVKDFLEKLDISQDDALSALLSAFAPLQPGVLRQNWGRLSTFGNSAPTTNDIWRKLEESDFRCSNCRSQLRVTLDHSDGNPHNHSYDNLVVLCFNCNRNKSTKKPVRDKQKKLRVYRAIMDHLREHKEFPTNREILDRSGVRGIDETRFMIAWIKKRLVVIDEQ